MRVNVYAEEMTDRIELISKTIDGTAFTGLRFYLELPATVGGSNYQGPFIHREGDDDSGAVTFWGKKQLREVLRKALALLDEHYAKRDGREPVETQNKLRGSTLGERASACSHEDVESTEGKDVVVQWCRDCGARRRDVSGTESNQVNSWSGWQLPRAASRLVGTGQGKPA